jgi:cyclic pyranopterin monophosphate synthase
MTDLDTPPLQSATSSDEASRPTAVRTAVARGEISVGSEVVQLLKQCRLPKGDAIEAARIAGSLGAKSTSRLLPFCREVLLHAVEIEVELDEDRGVVELRGFAKAQGSVGVEMEALTGVTVAALTLYDMCKSINPAMTIGGIELLTKTGGVSGDYRRSG